MLIAQMPSGDISGFFDSGSQDFGNPIKIQNINHRKVWKVCSHLEYNNNVIIQ